MPESPLSPTTARQTPARSLLTHKDGSTGERAANGDSCDGVTGETWQSRHQKQVIPFFFNPPTFILPCSGFSASNVGNKQCRCRKAPGRQTPKPAALLTVAGI